MTGPCPSSCASGEARARSYFAPEVGLIGRGATADVGREPGLPIEVMAHLPGDANTRHEVPRWGTSIARTLTFQILVNV